jgi:hypothetical protein
LQKCHNRYPLVTLFYLGGKEKLLFSSGKFPQDKGNILSILLKSGKYFLDYREDIPSGKLFFKGRVKIFFPDSREKFLY